MTTIKIETIPDVSDLGAIYQAFEDAQIDFDTANEYGEPGYDKPLRSLPILLANWNYVSKEAYVALEEAGYALEWCDEWITDDDGHAYRTSPDSFMWRPSYTLSPNCDVYGHTVSNIRDAIKTYKHSRDGDEWGTCAAWLFAAVSEMHMRSLDIPAEWQWSPGSGGGDCREWDQYETEECAQMTDTCLERFAGIMSKHYDKLKERGLNY
jgi:hypothetical protein